MSFVAPFGKRKIYLINHDPVNHAKQLEEMGVSFSKFLALQTINEFKDAVYNDFVAGELFSSEEAARKKLYSDEYYLELLVPSEAVSHKLMDGHVFIKPGYVPKIVALKTAQHSVYEYDERAGFYPVQQEPSKLPPAVRSIYNYNPQRWPVFTSPARPSAENSFTG
jgi:hypothetical protein